MEGTPETRKPNEYFFWNGEGRKQRGPRLPVALGQLSVGTRTADYFSNVIL